MTSRETPVVFLVGAPRSGTTLLYKALCLNRRVAFISNWVRRYPTLPALAGLDAVTGLAPTLRRTTWFDGDSNAYAYGRPRRAYQRAFPAPVEGEPVYARARVAALPGGRGVEPPDLGRLRRTFATVVRASRADVMVSKRIANNLRIPLLLEAFPDARFVHLQRDGRAVALSLSRVDWWPTDPVWWLGSTPAEAVRRGADEWELCGRHWVEEIRAADAGLAAVPASQRLELRYEDVLVDPVGSLRVIAGFAGLGADPGWEHQLAQLRFPDRNQTWRSALPAPAITTIERVQRDELRRHGYEV